MQAGPHPVERAHTGTAVRCFVPCPGFSGQHTRPLKGGQKVLHFLPGEFHVCVHEHSRTHRIGFLGQASLPMVHRSGLGALRQLQHFNAWGECARRLSRAIGAPVADHQHAHVFIQPLQEPCERTRNDNLFVVGGNENGVNHVPRIRVLLVEGPHGSQPPHDWFS